MQGKKIGIQQEMNDETLRSDDDQDSKQVSLLPPLSFFLRKNALSDIQVYNLLR